MTPPAARRSARGDRSAARLPHDTSAPAASHNDMSLGTMADGLPLIVWVYTGEGQRQYVNQAFLDFFGVTAAEVQGNRWQLLLHPTDAADYSERFAQAVATRSDFHAEARVRRADGEWRWIESWARPRVSETGEFMGFVGTSADITDRKETEVVSRLASARYALLSETAGLLLRAHDPQAVVEELCRKVMRHLDCDVFFNFLADSRHRRLRLNACAGVAPEDLEKVAWLDYGSAVCGRVALERQRFVGEQVQRMADPSTALIRSMGVQAYCCHPLIFGEEMIGTLSFGSRSRPRFAPDQVELMRAVSDQVAVAMERLRTERALRESEMFYRQTLESIPGMVFTTRPDGYCDFQSQQWVDFTGVPMAEQLGDGWNRLLHPDDRERAFDAWRAAVEGRAPYDLEYRVRRHDGAYEWFKVIGRPICGADGRIARWFGVAANIDANKRAEQELRRSKLEADAANRAKDHFLAVLSHELRTPLNPALMTAAILENDPQLPPDLRQDVSVIRRNVELEARLIDDMLDLTRIVRGKLALHRRVIDGCEPLRHAVETCQADAAEKAIALTCDWPDAPVYIDADAARLQQIYWNVIKNGVKFTPERGRITVVAAATERGGLRVQVSDSGKGIDPAALQRIFDAFEQVGDGVTHRYGGLGLGLAICKGLVELHGGSIRAASDGPGRGATFVVEFPPPVEKKGAPGEWTTASVGSPGGARMAGCRVLLVEDHEGTAQVTARLLRCYGHSVVTAGCVRDAVQAFEANPVDVVISDLGLPDGTGHELLGELLRIAKRPISAIAVSGYGMEHDLLQSAQAGFLEHLVKPINATQLQAAIARIHGGRPAASQAQRRGRSV